MTAFEDMLRADGGGPPPAAGSGTTAPIATPIQIGGLTGVVRDWAGPQLEELGFVPVGGGRAFAEHLIPTITEAGGEARAGVKVETLLVDGDRVVGVRTSDGEEIRSETVISGGNIGQVFITPVAVCSRIDTETEMPGIGWNLVVGRIIYLAPGRTDHYPKRKDMCYFSQHIFRSGKAGTASLSGLNFYQPPGQCFISCI